MYPHSMAPKKFPLALLSSNKIKKLDDWDSVLDSKPVNETKRNGITLDVACFLMGFLRKTHSIAAIYDVLMIPQ